MNSCSPLTGSDRYFETSGRTLLPDQDSGPPIHFTHGKGPLVYDGANRAYIDYICGSGPVILGHGDDEFTRKLSESIVLGLSLPGYGQAHQELSEKLEHEQPGKRVVSLFKTGSEAVTAAVRCAMMITGRKQLVRCGRLGWHDHLIYNSPNWHETHHSLRRHHHDHLYGYRGVGGDESVHNWIDLDLDSLSSILHANAGKIAAIAVDIYQLSFMTEAVLLEAIRLCRKHDIVVIFDETNTSGRTSPVGFLRDFANQPDFIILGKAIGNGAPISVLLGDEWYGRIYHRARIGGTHSKELFSVFAAIHVMDIMRERNGYHWLGVAGRKFCKIFNGVARDIRVHDAVRADPVFAGTLFDLRWSSDFIDSRHNRSLLLSTLRDAGILLLDGHCSFVNLAHFELNGDLLAEKISSALTNWKNSLFES